MCNKGRSSIDIIDSATVQMRSPLVMDILHTWRTQNAMQSSECRRSSLPYNLYCPYNNLSVHHDLTAMDHSNIFMILDKYLICQDDISMISHSMFTGWYSKRVNHCPYFSPLLEPKRTGTFCVLSSPFPHWVLCVCFLWISCLTV